MLKSKCFVCKFVPFILSIVIVFSTSVISVPAQVVDEIIFENEDSTFVLKNVNIQNKKQQKPPPKPPNKPTISFSNIEKLILSKIL